jgi:hypothetical protein
MKKKIYEISYREAGVRKSFTVRAFSAAEAKQIGWSTVDVDDIWVSEIG